MNTRLFPPSKRPGLFLHGVLLLLLLGASAWSFWRLSQQTLGLSFAMYLLAGVIAFAPAPVLAYRFYALLRAEYVLNRDTLE